MSASPAEQAERRRREPRWWAARLIVMALLLGIVALGVFGLLADEVFEGDTLRFDMAVRNAVHAHASPGVTLAMRAVSFLGSAVFLASVTTVLILVFAVAAHWPRAAALLGITMLGDVALETALKHMFQRARPEAFFGYALPSSYSFPSGHAMASFCFYLVIAGMLAHRVKGTALHVALWTAAAVVVGLIGMSRIYLGVHWPTDVIAGYAAAAVWVGTVVTVDGWRGRRNLVIE